MSERGVVKYESRDGQEITLTIDSIKRYLVSGKSELVTEQEVMYFMGICKSRGLNPFKKDCYLIKYGNDPAAIITSIDYFRSRARAQKDCRGWKKGIIVQDKEGNVKDTSGLVLDGEKILGGFFEAKPAGWDEPMRLEVNLNGYIKKTKDGRTTQFWQADKQPTMISKVAEGQGLRTLWPDEFQGLYEENEIRPLDGPVEMAQNGKTYVLKEDAQAKLDELKKRKEDTVPIMHRAPKGDQPETPQSEQTDEEYWVAFVKEWDGKRSSFPAYLEQNKDKFRRAPKWVQDKAEKKWKDAKETKDLNYPLRAPQEPEAETEDRKPAGQNQQQNEATGVKACPQMDGNSVGVDFCNGTGPYIGEGQGCKSRGGCPQWDEDGQA